MKEMEDMLEKAASGLKDGSIEIKNKTGKKGQFGKKFF